MDIICLTISKKERGNCRKQTEKEERTCIKSNF